MKLLYTFLIPAVLGGSLQFDLKRSANFLQKRSGANLELSPKYSENESEFVVELGFGSEKQKFELVVDTGSSDLWIPSSNATCNAKSSDDDVESCSSSGFDWENSKTFKKSSEIFSTEYGDNDTVEGFFGNDTVWVGDVEIKDIMFAVADEADTNPVLGIGLPKLELGYQNSSEPTYPNFPQKLKTDGIIDRILYSIMLGNSSSESSLLFGAIDHAKYNDDLVTFSVLTSNDGESDRMAINLDSIEVKDEKELTYFGEMTSAVLDTGSSLSVFSADILKQIAESLGGKVEDDTYYVNGDSAEKSKLRFKFKDLEFETDIQLKDGGSSDKRELKYDVLPDNLGIDGIIGQDVLTQAYAVFDLESNEISLAKQSGSSDTDIETVGSDGDFSKSSTAKTDDSKKSGAGPLNKVSISMLIFSLLFTVRFGF